MAFTLISSKADVRTVTDFATSKEAKTQAQVLLDEGADWVQFSLCGAAMWTRFSPAIVAIMKECEA